MNTGFLPLLRCGPESPRLKSMKIRASPFVVWYTIQLRATWAASQGMPAYLLRPMISLKYVEMLLGMGQRGRVRVFDPATVTKFTEPASPADQPILRGLGWDIDSPFSSNRGELYPIGSYGHTGFTGTSIWMDPDYQFISYFADQCRAPQARPIAQLSTVAASRLR